MLYDSPYRKELRLHYTMEVEGVSLKDGNPQIQYKRKHGKEFGTMIYVGNKTMEELMQMVGNNQKFVTDTYFWVCTTMQEFHSSNWRREVCY